MCGIAGFINNSLSLEVKNSVANSMCDALNHRGPDEQNHWIDEHSDLVMCHTRLAIIDLSNQGRQPMTSHSGRYIVSYNGEVYNHNTIRSQLPHLPWRGNSDTETLLAAIEEWGVDRAVDKLVGMFSFALFDKKLRTLTLVRDRFGEKPLYYGWQNGSFIFGSDLNAFAAHPNWQPSICRNSLSLYEKSGYVPSPWTIWQNTFKLPPGSLIRIPIDGHSICRPKPETYWDAVGEISRSEQSSLSERELILQTESLLKESITGQMQADVPVGVFLSGGIDSSLITALMQSMSTQKVRSFSIGFSETGFNEANYAKEIAGYLGTFHEEFYVNANEALDVIPLLPDIYGEPFADSSQIPTFLLSKLAQKEVTVCLTGDAGDEIFGGYNRYVWGPKLWNAGRRIPRQLRTVLSNFIQNLSPSHLNNLTRRLPNAFTIPAMGDQLYKLALILDCPDLNKVYEILTSPGFLSTQVVRDSEHQPTWADMQHNRISEFCLDMDPACKMMFSDIVGYLCDDILTKVDRAAMANSLETRIPILDHRLVRHAWSLPLNTKIRKGKGKWILRQILHKHVPEHLIDRPKQGFAIPLGNWLRGPLQDWAEDLLNTHRLSQQGLFDEKIVQRRWQEHLSGQRNWQNWLWSVLMFQQWHAKQGRLA